MKKIGRYSDKENVFTRVGEWRYRSGSSMDPYSFQFLDSNPSVNIALFEKTKNLLKLFFPYGFIFLQHPEASYNLYPDQNFFETLDPDLILHPYNGRVCTPSFPIKMTRFFIFKKSGYEKIGRVHANGIKKNQEC